MKSLYTFRRRLFAPTAYLVAIFLLFEEWLWNAGGRVMQRLAAWAPLRALENWIAGLPPYMALAAFVLPSVLLLPVKIMALFAIARGHALSGACVFLAAKLGGAAAVARLYTLTRPALLSLPWFTRCNDNFIGARDRSIALLRATQAWREAGALAAAFGAEHKAWWAALPARRAPGPNGAMPRAVLQRFVALWRARRR